ncbi:beta-N-acetylglucosaminidase domain-containing protein [Streptacidiphilus sp. N1-12]|uniref:Beta-N-acetylglucosaminidase domain-containing protein n=2 Tax=Streptacidiphilus alkalitolerans TaxID=3342712 RepID=A0ABV6WJT4_9ACTN
MDHRPSLPASAGSGLRRRLEQHAARTARRIAPEAADRLIAEFKARVGSAATAPQPAQGRRRGRALRASAALTVAAVVGGMVTGTQGSFAAAPAAGRVGATSTPGPVTVPQVFPRPQTQTAYGQAVAVPAVVTLVAAPKADPGALAAVREVLTAAGAQRVDESSDAAPSGRPAAGSLTVYVGGLAEGAGGGTDRALRDLASAGGHEAPLSPSGLPDGGYVLAAGRTGSDGAGAVVLAGVDAAGTFNAAQSLRQLVVSGGQGSTLPGVRITDWPTTPVRGTEEGFYGTPWTPAQTLDEIGFLGRTKQNFFLYAPGDDPYRSSRWRDTYPAAQQAQLRALARQAALNHVTLGYGLALGGSVCFTSAKDQQALLDKLDALWGLGVRSFQLQFQDSSFTHWHCDADHARYGTGPAAMARAQSDLVQLVLRRFSSKHPDAAPLSVLPTEYYQDGATPYRTALAQRLDPSVQVAWTGVGVQPTSITGAQTTAAGQAFGHPLVTQDNYPVNDSNPDRLYLGPYLGREPGVATGSAALLVNAMQQPLASRIPLFTAADYAWNPSGYDAASSWQAATRDLAGGRPEAAAALAALAGNSASPAPDGTAAAGTVPDGQQESAYLRPLIADFRLGQGTPAASAALRAAFTTMATAPQVLASADSGVGGEDGPWLAQLAVYGRAGQAAVDMLTEQRSGQGAKAWSAQVSLRRLVARLAQSDVTVGAGVLDPFLKHALAEAASWAGVGGGQIVSSSSMGTAQDHDPAQMVDGDAASYYWSDAPPQVGDTVGIDLGSVQPVASVTVRMGGGDDSVAADDYLHQAVLEYSSGEGGWHRVAVYRDQKVVTATLPSGTTARYLRLRATATQTSAVAVREFSVSAPTSSTATVTGGPVGRPGYPIGNVADGDLNTAYRAVAPPQAGDALTMTLGTARPMDQVLVLTDPDVVSAGWVEVHRVGGAWVRVGALSAGYTDLPVDPRVPVDQVRLVWAGGGEAPVVQQIVPWYADAPTAALQLPQQSVDLEIGGAPTTLTGDLQALGASGASGTVAAVLPKGVKGLTVGVPGPVALPRGGRLTLPLVFRAAAGTAPGTYPVTVVFTAGGQTVTQAVQVHVYPRTDGADLALGATAGSSGDETPDFPASAVNDGLPDTRWSSPAKDDAWVQLELARPATVGEAVLHWQDAYAAQYRIETSADGVTWTTAATVLNGAGGDETVHFDAPDVRYVRMQGVQRATRFGYSLFGIELYAVAGTTSVGTPVSIDPPPSGLPTPPAGGVPSAPATGAPTAPAGPVATAEPTVPADPLSLGEPE